MKPHVDLGQASEDQMRSPDVPPNGRLDTEYRSEGGAALDLRVWLEGIVERAPWCG